MGTGDLVKKNSSAARAAHTAAVAVAFLLITFLHIVFGELIPKTMALQTPGRSALWPGH